jgi:hypothetical protein
VQQQSEVADNATPISGPGFFHQLPGFDLLQSTFKVMSKTGSVRAISSMLNKFFTNADIDKQISTMNLVQLTEAPVQQETDIFVAVIYSMLIFSVLRGM